MKPGVILKLSDTNQAINFALLLLSVVWLKAGYSEMWAQYTTQSGSKYCTAIYCM